MAPASWRWSGLRKNPSVKPSNAVWDSAASTTRAGTSAGQRIRLRWCIQLAPNPPSTAADGARKRGIAVKVDRCHQERGHAEPKNIGEEPRDVDVLARRALPNSDQSERGTSKREQRSERVSDIHVPESREEVTHALDPALQMKLDDLSFEVVRSSQNKRKHQDHQPRSHACQVAQRCSRRPAAGQ